MAIEGATQAHRWGRRAVVTALLGLAPALAAPESVHRADIALRFNLVCAVCHEGECSGRLSFDSGASGAGGHIRRYVAEADDAAVRELYRLLERMKTDCAYPPQDDLGPADRQTTELARYRDAQANGYFIPLGHLAAGDYRVELALGGPVRTRIEVVSAAFEVLADVELCADRAPGPLEIAVEEAMAHFLRVRSRSGAPVVVESLRITPVPEPR